MQTRPRRSALFVPASNTRAIAKARALSCDVVILDLEDAVAPEMKVLARDQAVEALRAGEFGDRELLVRVNGVDTPWGADDLRAITTARLDGLLIPKVSEHVTLEAARRTLGDAAIPLWAMIETCRAVPNIGSIAGHAATYGLAGFVAGTNDLEVEMRCRPAPGRGPLLPLLAMLVVAARSAISPCSMASATPSATRR